MRFDFLHYRCAKYFSWAAKDSFAPPLIPTNICSHCVTRHFLVWISVKPITTTAYPGFIIDEVKEASEEEDLDQDEDEDKIEYSNSSGWGRTTSADDNILRNILSRGKRERTISEVQNTKHSLAVPSNATNKAFIKRNVSTPGFGRLARLDSVQEREVQQILSGSSALVYEVQVYENIIFLLLLLHLLFLFFFLNRFVTF